MFHQHTKTAVFNIDNNLVLYTMHAQYQTSSAAWKPKVRYRQNLVFSCTNKNDSTY